jgi:hypothetical protein
VRRVILPLSIAILLVAVTFGVLQAARGQGQGREVVLNQDTQGDNTRQITGSTDGNTPDQPSIGFIDSPSSTCYQPDPTQDMCYINWYYLSVSADPSYMISMTVALNAIGFVSRTSGFFQTSMYTPYNMYGDGFKVPCGSAGAGGHPVLGNAYAWTIRARDSAGLSSANYGTTYCPAFNTPTPTP